MADDGVFCIHRSIFTHPLLVGEPYTRMQAWVWLLGNAVWKAKRVRVKDSMFDLGRGQCAYSVRFLAVQWRWSKSRAARFLDVLKDEQMIDTQAGRDATLISICKYDDYQLTPGHTADTERDAGGTQAGRRRDKEEELNKRIEIVREPAKRTSEADPSFIEFYSAYPRRQSKQDAMKAYAQVRKGGVSHETILAGLARAKRSDSRFRDPRFTPLPASWLRAGGFEDEAGGAAPDDWKKAVYG